MINNLIHTQALKLAMYEQHPDQLEYVALINRMKIKDEQMMKKLKRLAALLCASCEEIGIPDTVDLTVELGSAIDE